MKTLELHTTDGRCIARRVSMACSFRSRCIGLLNQSNLLEHEGLLLVPGASIHTLGMRFDIDVVFLNRQMRVLGLAERVPPWRIVRAPRGTGRVLELAAGKIATTRLTTGAYLIVDAPSDDPSERTTVKPPRLRQSCQCTPPIQFSLRLPLERRCTDLVEAECSAGARRARSLPPCRRELDSRARTTPTAGT